MSWCIPNSEWTAIVDLEAEVTIHNGPRYSPEIRWLTVIGRAAAQANRPKRPVPNEDFRVIVTRKRVTCKTGSFCLLRMYPAYIPLGAVVCS